MGILVYKRRPVIVIESVMVPGVRVGPLGLANAFAGRSRKWGRRWENSFYSLWNFIAFDWHFEFPFLIHILDMNMYCIQWFYAKSNLSSESFFFMLSYIYVNIQFNMITPHSQNSLHNFDINLMKANTYMPKLYYFINCN